MNLDLFSEAKGMSQPESIQLPDAEIVLCRGLFSSTEADQFFTEIMRETVWEEEKSVCTARPA